MEESIFKILAQMEMANPLLNKLKLLKKHLVKIYPLKAQQALMLKLLKHLKKLKFLIL
jgi:hypothetical protein